MTRPRALPITEAANGTDASTAPETALNPLLQRPLREAPAVPVNGVAIGRVTAVTADGILVRVAVPGEQVDPPQPEALPARALCALPDDWAERECAVLFENGDPTRPLIVGFLLPTAHAHQPIPDREPTDRELTVDGEKVVIQADTELELRCGESVILLQRDGRIEIRGNYITSQATATQRLRGGSIHMN